MKHSLFITLNLAALLIAGCSSTPTKLNSGAISGTTFSFIGGGSQAASFADSREAVHGLIQDSITRNLAGKGLSKVATGGDVVVAYLVLIGNGVSTTAINKYFGYGRDADALQEKAHEAYGRSKNPDSFEAGTLLVDFVDGKSFKLLKRTYVTRPILRDPSAEVRAERINEAVTAVLKDVQINR